MTIDILISIICFVGFICSLLFLLHDAKEQEIISNEYEAYYDKHNSKHYTKHDHHYMRKYNK